MKLIQMRDTNYENRHTVSLIDGIVVILCGLKQSCTTKGDSAL